MALGILVLITALTISGVAIYYSVAGLVAIFAAAALPIMIMGGALEIAKLVTAVWLHRYWRQTVWWLKSYLTLSVVVLMLITSMGIFGFLSKAHIEQTSASQESVAQVERLDTEIARQESIIDRAETKIKQLESSGTGADANIQAQIDKEQERIDKAFERIQPAIEQQNKIIADARQTDNTRTKPYEDQLTSIQNEIGRLESTAREYEDKIANLSADTSAVDPLLEQIDAIEKEIIRVTNQVNSGERDQIRAGQAIIGVTSDGAFGSNTRKALVAWVAAQRERITQIQGDISRLRQDATTTVDAERERLAGVVADIRQTQIPALKDRELTMLSKIDEVRQTESPAIATARDEIQRLRQSAEDQVANSQALIERLRGQLAQTDKAAEIDAQVQEQNTRIKNANAEIDTLTEEKYALEAEYRKLEAEVGPVKYIAEFVYGDEAGKDLLEEAVRWVILIIIFVFDPLAVLLLIASQYTFEQHRKRKDDDGDWLRRNEQARAQRIVDNPGYTVNTPEETKDEKSREETRTEESQDAEELRPGQYGEGVAPETGVNPDVVETQEERQVDGGLDIRVSSADSAGAGDHAGDTSEGVALAGGDALDDYVQSYVATNDTDRDVVPEDDTAVADAVATELESPEVQVDEALDQVEPKKKVKPTESSEELKREADLEAKEESEEYQIGKSKWKADHPEDTLKRYKNLYIKGVIDTLPWERPQYTTVEEPEGYKQNAEQNESSIFNRIRSTQQDQDNNKS